MKKTLVTGCALLALAAGLASAAPGVNLSWNDCGLAGQQDQSFACDTNDPPPHILVGSFVAPAGVNELNGMLAIVDMVTSGDVLSPWWDLGNPGCRSGSLSANFNFVLGPFTCFDYWAGQATGGFAALTPSTAPASAGPNRARFKFTCAIPSGATAITEGTEVYAFEAIINNAKTVGTGACGGCTDGACLVLSLIQLAQTVEPGNINLSYAAADRYYVTW